MAIAATRAALSTLELVNPTNPAPLALICSFSDSRTNSSANPEFDSASGQNAAAAGQPLGLAGIAVIDSVENEFDAG